MDHKKELLRSLWVGLTSAQEGAPGHSFRHMCTCGLMYPKPYTQNPKPLLVSYRRVQDARTPTPKYRYEPGSVRANHNPKPYKP